MDDLGYAVAIRPRGEMATFGFQLLAAAHGYSEHAKAFFYAVVLAPHACPRCEGELAMMREGQCRCSRCGSRFDPTMTFQRCASCQGLPRVRIRHYECRRCGAEIASRFLFHGLVFDAAYFRAKVAEHRQRKREQTERIKAMLAENRSDILEPAPVDLANMPDLVAVLNALSIGGPEAVQWTPQARFDLKRYEAHVEAHLGPVAIRLEEIPPLGQNARLDRIWRFIAVVFLAHARVADVQQNGLSILVKRHEIDPERQGLHGSATTAHGLA